jgi:hypothetical protein
VAEFEKEAFLLPSTHPHLTSERTAGGSSISSSDLSYVANGWDNVPGLPMRTDEWFEAADEASTKNIILAIDCEMVDTSRGK